MLKKTNDGFKNISTYEGQTAGKTKETAVIKGAELAAETAKESRLNNITLGGGYQKAGLYSKTEELFRKYGMSKTSQQTKTSGSKMENLFAKYGIRKKSGTDFTAQQQVQKVNPESVRIESDYTASGVPVKDIAQYNQEYADRQNNKLGIAEANVKTWELAYLSADKKYQTASNKLDHIIKKYGGYYTEDGRLLFNTQEGVKAYNAVYKLWEDAKDAKNRAADGYIKYNNQYATEIIKAQDFEEKATKAAENAYEKLYHPDAVKLGFPQENGSSFSQDRSINRFNSDAPEIMDKTKRYEGYEQAYQNGKYDLKMYVENIAKATPVLERLNEKIDLMEHQFGYQGGETLLAHFRSLSEKEKEQWISDTFSREGAFPKDRPNFYPNNYPWPPNTVQAFEFYLECEQKAYKEQLQIAYNQRDDLNLQVEEAQWIFARLFRDAKESNSVIQKGKEACEKAGKDYDNALIDNNAYIGLVNVNPSDAEAIAATIQKKYPLSLNVELLTNDEQKIYYYLVGEGNADYAVSFAKAIIEQRQLENDIELFSTPVLREVYGLVHALESAVTAPVKWLDPDFDNDHFITDQNVYAGVKANATGFARFTLGAAEAIGSMAPAIFATAVGGPLAGKVVTFITAGGNAVSEGIKNGMSYTEALVYGGLSGLSEATLESVLGGNRFLGQSSASKAITSFTSNIKSPLLKTAAKVGGNLLSEVAEENVQEFLTPAFELIAKEGLDFFTDTKVAAMYDAPEWGDLLDTTLTTLLTTFVMEAGSLPSTYKNVKFETDVIKPWTDSVMKNLPKDSEAYQVAAKFDGMIKNGEDISTKYFLSKMQASGLLENLDFLEMAKKNNKKPAEMAADDSQGKSTAVNDNPATHTEQEMQVIEEYKNSTDSKLVAFIQKVRTLKNKSYRSKISFDLGTVTQKQAQDVQALSGVDVSAYSNSITGGAVDHVDARHGVNGKADSSMADDSDFARIGYVLQTYDSVELVRDESGEPILSSEWQNKDQSHAQMVRFAKKIDGTYYVVEAVPDSSKQQLRVVSAYMQKNSGSSTRLLNMEDSSSPQLTPSTPAGMATSAMHSIPQSAGSVKTGTDAKTAQGATERRAEMVQAANPNAEVLTNDLVQKYLDVGVPLATARKAAEVLEGIMDGEITSENITNRQIDALGLYQPKMRNIAAQTLGVELHKGSMAEMRREFKTALRQYEARKAAQNETADTRAVADETNASETATFTPETNIAAEAISEAPVRSVPTASNMESAASEVAQTETEQPDTVTGTVDGSNQTTAPAIDYSEFEQEYLQENPDASPTDIALAYQNALQGRSDTAQTFTGYGVVRDAYSNQVDSELVEALDEIAKLFGVRIRFDNLAEINDNGQFNPNTKEIILDIHPNKPFFAVAGHEIVHRLRDKIDEKAWRNFENYAVAAMGGKKAVAEKQEYSEAYAKASDAREEVACDFLGKLINDKEMLNDFCEAVKKYRIQTETVNLLVKSIRKVFDSIRTVIGRRRLTGKVAQNFNIDEKAAKETVKALQEVYKIASRSDSLFRNKKTTKDGGVKHSFKGYDSETGRGMYEGNFPKGTPKAAKASVILEYIQKVWSKKPIDLVIKNSDGSERAIQAKFDPSYDATGNTQTDASKLMGGNRHGTSAEQRVTLDLADDYYQIASESKYNYSKDETGKTTSPHKDVKQWHYFVNDIYFAEYGSNVYEPYRVSINIKEKSSGEYVYSFSAEKGESSSQRTLHAVVNGTESTAKGKLSNSTIPQTTATVNPTEQKNIKRDVKVSDKFDTTGTHWALQGETVKRDVKENDRNFGVAKEGDKKFGVVRDAYSEQVEPELVEALDEIAELFGVRIRFDSLPDDNGQYHKSTGEIVLDVDAVKPLNFVAGHEITHRLRDMIDDKAWRNFENYAVAAMGGKDAVAKKQSSHEAYADPSVAREEVACDFVGKLISDKAMLSDFCEAVKKYRVKNETAKALTKIISNVFDSIRSAIGKRKLSSKVAESFNVDEKTAKEAVSALQEAYKQAGKNNALFRNEKTTADGGVKRMIRENFSSEIDAWDGISKKVFKVGTTSKVLQSIGVKSSGITWYGGKISEIMSKHPAMSKDVIKQVPQILENPVIVLSSKNYDSRLVIFGTVTDEKGSPVTAILELQPKTKGGQIMNMTVVASAYGKDGSIKKFVEDSGLVYLDPDKKRTGKWMQSVGLQLPSDATAFGSVGSITYPDGIVKIESVPYKQYAQKNIKRDVKVSDKFDTTGTHWALQEGLIDKKDLAIFYYGIANLSKRGYSYHRTYNGEYIIESGNKMIFTNGDFNRPNISRVITFNDTHENNMADYKEWIYNAVDQRDPSRLRETLRIIENIEGVGYAVEQSNRIDGTYERKNGRGEGSNRRADSQRAESTKVKHDKKMPDASYEAQVDKVKANTHDSSNHIYMGTTPVRLVNTLGLPKLPMLITPNHIYSVAVFEQEAKQENRHRKGTHYHGLGWDTVKKLPEYIGDPVLIIKSNTNPEDARFVVVTNRMDSDGNPIVAAIKPNGEAKYFGIDIASTAMLSSYGKENFRNYLARAKTENRILYVDKKRSHTEKNGPGLYLSNAILSVDFTKSLTQFRDIVNRKFAGTAFANDSGSKKTRFDKKTPDEGKRAYYSERYGTELTTAEQVERAAVREERRAETAAQMAKAGEELARTEALFEDVQSKALEAKKPRILAKETAKPKDISDMTRDELAEQLRKAERDLKTERLLRKKAEAQMTRTVGSKTDPTGVYSSVKRIVKEYDDSGISRERMREMTDETVSVFDKAATIYDTFKDAETAAMAIYDYAYELADQIAKEAVVENPNAMREDYADLRAELKETTFLLPKTLAHDVSPDFGAWRKRNIGNFNVKLVDDGTGNIDSVYEGLAEAYPGLFRSSLGSEADLLLDIERVANALSKKSEIELWKLMDEASLEEMRLDIAQKLMQEFIRVQDKPRLKTRLDKIIERNNAKIEALRAEMTKKQAEAVAEAKIVQEVKDTKEYLEAMERSERKTKAFVESQQKKLNDLNAQIERLKRKEEMSDALSKRDLRRNERTIKALKAELKRAEEHLQKEVNRRAQDIAVRAFRRSGDGKQAQAAIRKWLKNSGIPADILGETEIKTVVLSAEEVLERKNVKQKGKFRKAAHKTYENLVSNTATLEAFARKENRKDNVDTKITMYRNRDANLAAIFDTHLIDPNGNVLDDRSLSDIILCRDEKGDYDEEAQALLDTYRYHLHGIDRMSFEQSAKDAMMLFLKRHPEYNAVGTKKLTIKEIEHRASKGDDAAMEYVMLAKAYATAKNKPVYGDVNGNAVNAETHKAVVKSLEAKNPWLVNKSNEIDAWWDKFMRSWAVGSFLSENSYDAMGLMYKHYTPTFRDLDKNTKKLLRNYKSGINVRNPVLKAKGSTLDLLPVADNFAYQISNIVRQRRLNDIFQNLYEAAVMDDTGKFSGYVRIADSAEFVDASDELSSDYVSEYLTEDAHFKNIDNVARWTGMVNGNSVTLEISEDVYQDLLALTRSTELDRSPGWRTFNMIGRFLSLPLKVTATGYSLVFPIKNFIRDQATAIIYEGFGILWDDVRAVCDLGGYGVAKILNSISNVLQEKAHVSEANRVIQFLDALENRLTKNNMWQLFKDLGGAGSNEIRNIMGYGARENMQSVIKQWKTKHIAGGMWTAVKKGLSTGKAALGAVGNFTESLTRYAAFVRHMRKDGDTAENRVASIKASAEVTLDFSRHGRATALSSYTPYFNANIQGVAKFIGEIKNRKGFEKAHLIKRGILVNGLPTVAIIAIVKHLLSDEDEEAYRDLTQRERDAYLNIPLGNGKFFRIPKEQSYTQLIVNPVERILLWATDGDPDSELSDYFSDYLETSIMGSFLPNMPIFDSPIIGTIIDVLRNEDFAGRAIVPAKFEGTTAHDESTSSFANWLGEALDVSPYVIDYWIKDNFSSYGDMFISMTDSVSSGGIWGEVTNAYASAFIVDSAFTSQTVTDYYELLNEMETQRKTDKHNLSDEEYQNTLNRKTQSAIESLYGKQITDLNDKIKDTQDEAEIRTYKLAIKELAAQALDFYDKCMSGEIEEPTLYAAYNAYGSTVRDELTRLDKYTSDEYDFTFLPNADAPEIGNHKNTDEQKEFYKELYYDKYSTLAESVISSKEYQDATDEEKCAMLEGVRDLAHFNSKKEFAQKYGLSSDSYDPVADENKYDSIMTAGASFDLAHQIVDGISNLEPVGDATSVRDIQKWAHIAEVTSGADDKVTDAAIRAYMDEEQTARYDRMLDAGFSAKEAISIAVKADEINENNKSIENKYDRMQANEAAFKRWLNKQKWTDEQKAVALKENGEEWTQTPVNSEKYDAFVNNGIDEEKAERLFNEINALQPEDGADKVTTKQAVKYAISVDYLSNKDKYKAIETYYSGDSDKGMREKIKTAKSKGIKAKTFIKTVFAMNEIEGVDKNRDGKADKNSKKDNRARYLQNATHLSTKEKDAFWLMYYPNSSPDGWRRT